LFPLTKRRQFFADRPINDRRKLLSDWNNPDPVSVREPLERLDLVVPVEQQVVLVRAVQRPVAVAPCRAKSNFDVLRQVIAEQF
jgi:hypothetical protein